MTFGIRLNQSLKAAQKSRKTLASHLNVSPQAVGMVITGGGKLERRLSPENTRSAADFLNVDYQWLSTGDHPQTAERPNKAEITGLSPDAIDLAVFFDMLTERIDRAIAKNVAMTEILRLLALRADPPIVALAPVVNPKKQ